MEDADCFYKVREVFFFLLALCSASQLLREFSDSLAIRTTLYSSTMDQLVRYLSATLITVFLFFNLEYIKIKHSLKCSRSLFSAYRKNLS